MSTGYELTRSGNSWRGKLHDSLVIQDNGLWYWNSRDLHGKSPVELYKQILLNDYGYTDEMSAAITAIKQLAAGRGTYSCPAPTSRGPDHPARPPDIPLVLPSPFKNNNRVMAYLCQTRGLDPDIVRGLIRYGKIYETAQRWDRDAVRYIDTPYHNAVFVAYDKDKRPQNAFLRGISSLSDKLFKRDLDFSDKSYAFTLCGRPRPDRVFCFEGAIDAISHASIYKMNGEDWRDGYRISLGGYARKQEKSN